jgi:hypothetical protein
MQRYAGSEPVSVCGRSRLAKPDLLRYSNVSIHLKLVFIAAPLNRAPPSIVAADSAAIEKI